MTALEGSRVAAGRVHLVADCGWTGLEAYVDGSFGIPIHEILDRLDEIPAGEVWVHCAGGYRAGVVAARLDARGHDVVAVDDTFDHTRPAGLPVVTAAG